MDSYSFLDVIWSMILFFLFILWIFIVIRILMDIFRREMSGWVKGAWLVFVILLPFLGVLVYVIAEGRSMGERDLAQAQEQQESFDTYVKSVTGSSGAAGEISQAKELLDNGAITQEEFDKLKAKALGA